MDFEDYKTKIQKVSNVLQSAKCPEDVLNSKDIDLNVEFQYLCLNSNVNYELVNEVIARLAQNGNKNIIESNVKCISVNMWDGLFNINKDTKDIFIRNFKDIVDSTGILTFRDIENFISDDEDVQSVLYDNVDIVIRKLCTYDRASLINCLKTKPNGAKVIHENIEQFFRKGEYDISTTYSKIVGELSNVPEISREEIMEICSKNLTQMLERETAVDNETNKLLNWVYDSMEEAHFYPEQRAEIQGNIDRAIMENFECILDKTNYDKETIKILKLFPCTHERFSTNKNMFIENSSKLLHMTKIYDFEYERESEAANELVKYSEENNSVFEESEKCCEKLQQSSEDSTANSSNIIDILVKSNLEDTNKIIDKVIKREDNEIANQESEITPVQEGGETENNQAHVQCGKYEVEIDYGMKDIVEYVKLPCENNTAQSGSTEAETSIAVISEQEHGFNRMLNFVKGFFRKIKRLVIKNNTERIGD